MDINAIKVEFKEEGETITSSITINPETNIYNAVQALEGAIEGLKQSVGNYLSDFSALTENEKFKLIKSLTLNDITE